MAFRIGALGLQFTQQFEDRFLAPLRGTGEVDLGPASHVIGQKRIHERIEFGPGQGTLFLRTIGGTGQQEFSSIHTRHKGRIL
jgi:hypothetical protein